MLKHQRPRWPTNSSSAMHFAVPFLWLSLWSSGQTATLEPENLRLKLAAVTALTNLNKHTSSGKNMGIINLPLRNYPTRLERKLVMKHLLTTLIHGETWKLSQMFLAKDQIPEVWSNWTMRSHDGSTFQVLQKAFPTAWHLFKTGALSIGHTNPRRYININHAQQL